MLAVHGNELSGPGGQVASPLYPRSYVHYGSFSWRIMVDIGRAIAITFKDFFIEFYFSNCYSSIAVSNEMYFFISIHISVLAAGDGLSCWKFNFKQFKVMVFTCSKCTIFEMCNVSKLMILQHGITHRTPLHSVCSITVKKYIYIYIFKKF
jgi:hypothetical protein